MRFLSVACAAGLAAAVALAGCSAAKPPRLDVRASPKGKKKLSVPEEAQEDGGQDGGPDYGGASARRRNLPLAGTAWVWEGMMGADSFDYTGDPSRYSLAFKPNGWFDFQADCKHGAGIYEANGRRIVLAVIRSSHAACRHGSQAGDFVSALEGVKGFRQADGRLYFELKRNPKTMVFGLKP
jgi:heat shock protein HslJ